MKEGNTYDLERKKFSFRINNLANSVNIKKYDQEVHVTLNEISFPLRFKNRKNIVSNKTLLTYNTSIKEWNEATPKAGIYQRTRQWKSVSSKKTIVLVYAEKP